MILITRPNYDITTRYLFAWSGKIIEKAAEKGIKVLNLEKTKANKKEFESRLSKMDPNLILLNGHGDINCVTGHGHEVLLEGGKNEHILRDKIIYALSCKSAAELGPKSIIAGAKCYIGYDDDFIFLYDEHKIGHPIDDELAKLFLEPSNQVAISLIKGNNCKEATKRSRGYFVRNLQRVLSSDAPPETSPCATYLWWDIQHQVCLGEGDSKFI